MRKKSDLSDFEQGMVIDARWTGLSISEADNPLGFSHTSISRVYREWSEIEKTSSEQLSAGQRCLVGTRSQRWKKRLVQDNRKATVTWIITHHNQVIQKTFTTSKAPKQMGYSTRRHHKMPLLTVPVSATTFRWWGQNLSCKTWKQGSRGLHIWSK